MTQEQFDQAKQLIEKRDYYRKLASDIRYSVDHKVRLDEKEKMKYGGGRLDNWLLSHFCKVTLKKKDDKPVVGVLPHYELSRTIEIDAEPELVELIIQWLIDKTEELDNQIENI